MSVSAYTLKQMIAIRREKPKEKRLWLERQHSLKPRCHYCKCKTTLEPRGYSTHSNQPGSLHATLDHVIPLSKRGRDIHDNWVLACFTCNMLKADMPAHKYIAELKAAGVTGCRA